MVAPLDVYPVIHNGFRRDLTEIDEAVYKVARHGGDLSPLIDRLYLVSQILDRHAQGEDEYIFPALDRVAPLLAPMFVDDHKEMDIMTDGLGKVVNAPDELAAARASAVLHSHVQIHLAKEEAYVFPVLGQRLDPEEQALIVGQAGSKTPRQLVPQFVNWLFPLVNQQDRVTMTAHWKASMPEEVFLGVRSLIKGTLTSDDWSEVKRRVPGLD